MINERKGLFLTAGNGKTSFVSTKDIAKVAAQSFKNKDFGSEYDLTGSEAYSHREVADMISEATGKEVMYNDLTDDELREAARQQGMPEDAIKYMAELYGAVRAGKSSQVTPFVKRVSGEDPVQFMDFIEENADMWK